MLMECTLLLIVFVIPQWLISIRMSSPQCLVFSPYERLDVQNIVKIRWKSLEISEKLPKITTPQDYPILRASRTIR
eukprot:1390888-Amorphochlora_amoeboformis.AAC.1